MDLEKYNSRKLGLSLLVLVATVYLARTASMDAHTALILTGLITSYNGMQGWIDKVKAGK